MVAPVDADGVELHKSSCPSGGTVDLFLEPMGTGPRLVVCGASPVAVTLAGLAKAMGWRVVAATLIEDRDAMAAADQWIQGFDLATAAIGPRDAVVVVTQGRRDADSLKAALASAAGYVGMVGSRTKIGKLTARIAGDVPADRLAALHGPAGLPLGAIDPEEIALAILAEIVGDRRARAKSGNAVAAGESG